MRPNNIETMNNRYKTNLRLGKLIDKNALAENLVTSIKRRYNDAVVQQLLSFRFAEVRLNVGIYGITEAGKILLHVCVLQRSLPQELPLYVCGLL